MSCVCQEIVRDLSLSALSAQISLRKGLSVSRDPGHWSIVDSQAGWIDNLITFTRQRSDTQPDALEDYERMGCLLDLPMRIARWVKLPVALLVGAHLLMPFSSAQDTPLISGGVGFVSRTNGGNTTYIPILEPVLAAPLGSRVLVESRATLLESFSPKGSGQPGYASTSFLGLSYLQADVTASSHLTLVGGEFLTPFGTYNERLTPLWIGTFEDAPLIFGLGTMGTASSVGGMLRGSAVSTQHVSVDYAAYFSATSTNQQFDSERSSGGKGSIYFPGAGLEVGASYGRRLQDTHANFVGAHLWWEPVDTPFRFRSEYAHGTHAHGYWLEADYRLSHFGGRDSVVGRLDPAVRWQQTFRGAPDPSDGLPSANTNQVDFAVDYNLPREVRILSSYSRQLSSTGNRNLWQTGIVYRFLFPTWKGK